jgi:hypothetical protein
LPNAPPLRHHGLYKEVYCPLTNILMYNPSTRLNNIIHSFTNHYHFLFTWYHKFKFWSTTCPLWDQCPPGAAPMFRRKIHPCCHSTIGCSNRLPTFCGCRPPPSRSMLSWWWQGLAMNYPCAPWWSLGQVTPQPAMQRVYWWADMVPPSHCFAAWGRHQPLSSLPLLTVKMSHFYLSKILSTDFGIKRKLSIFYQITSSTCI